MVTQYRPRTLEGAFPHAEIVRLSDGSHYLPEDDPEGISYAIQDRHGYDKKVCDA